jgi:hypothetical protein
VTALLRYLRYQAALLRYQADLLWGSRRWLPPLLFYGGIMVIGLSAGWQSLLDSLGYHAAMLLLTAAWLARVCITGEPPAARAVVAAAAGPGRAHLACLLTALLSSTALGMAGTIVVLAVGDPRTSDHLTAVPRGPAAAAGLLTALISTFLGTAVSALTNRPVVRRPGWSVLGTVGLALLVLLAVGSPANAAVTDLVTGAETGRVPLPVVPLLIATVTAAGAAAVACWLTSRRAP